MDLKVLLLKQEVKAAPPEGEVQGVKTPEKKENAVKAKAPAPVKTLSKDTKGGQKTTAPAVPAKK